MDWPRKRFLALHSVLGGVADVLLTVARFCRVVSLHEAPAIAESGSPLSHGFSRDSELDFSSHDMNETLAELERRQVTLDKELNQEQKTIAANLKRDEDIRNKLLE